MKITITGIGGVGKGTITDILSKELKLQNFSGGNFFRQRARELGLTLYEFDQLVRKESKYDLELDKMQEKFGKENDDFILESRLGWYFIPDSFKIRLDCEEEERLRRLIERDGLDREELRKKEQERLDAVNERYKKLYGIENWRDDKHFDLIVDTSKLTPEEVAYTILNSLKEKGVLNKIK